MSKKFLAVGVIALALASCGGPGAEKFDSTAKEICDCMANVPELSDEEVAMGLTRDIDYGNCVKDIDAEMIKGEQMVTSIKSVCPDLSELHIDYSKSI